MLASSRKPGDYDLLELKRRIRRVTQVHIVDRPGYPQYDRNALCLGFQTHVQDRLDAKRVKK